MVQVELGRDDTGAPVLVKVADAGAGADRVRREAEALAVAEEAGVTGVVRLVDLADEVGGGVRLRTGWVGGSTVERRAASGPIGAAVVRRWGGALAATLGQLHAAGLVHGRVTADHVLVDGNGDAVLCGFGGARLPDETGAPEPVDDVATVGALLAPLVRDLRGSDADAVRLAVARAAGPAAARPGAAALADLLTPGPTAAAPAAVAPARDAGERSPDGRCRLPARPRPAPTRRPPVGVLAAGAVAVVLLVVTGLFVLRLTGSDADALPPAETVPTTTAACPPVTGAVLRADVDGDGCLEAMSVTGGLIEVGARLWRVGRSGDLVTVGDWDCDGLATPAVARPATGEVWAYDTWATSGSGAVARAIGRAEGIDAVAAVPTAGDGCDAIEARLIGGGRRLLPVPAQR